MPVLVKIFAVFGLILLLNRLRLPLSLSLFLGSLILGLWMGMGPVQMLQTALFSVTRLQTIALSLIVGLILVMSKMMQESGHLDRLVKSFTRLSRDARTVGSVMSALIGLLPMPGGALFSAPMVQTSLLKHSATGEQKTALNYWFRHIWEYWWPLYPGVVLAVALLEVDLWHYMAFMAPMTLVSLFAGVIFILKPIGKTAGREGKNISLSAVRLFMWEIMPIMIVIFVIILIAGLVGILGFFGIRIKIPGTLSILPGLIASTIWVGVVNAVPLRQFWSAILNRQNLTMLLLIVAIMIFKGVMTQSGAVLQIRDELMAYGIPFALLVIILPFVSGFITGVALGFVGTSFPLIIPLFQTHHPIGYMASALLAFVFGYMGMMLSPVHLCLLVSKDYFKAGLLNSYRYLVMPALTVMLTGLFLFFLLRGF